MGLELELIGQLEVHPEEEELAHGDVVDRYSVLGCLGRGGMGVVYKAYDPRLDRSVALKLLRRGRSSPTSDLRLLREAKTLAQLRHPNVVTVYDAGLTNHGVFIAMELLSGKSINEWLEQQTRGVRQILDVFLAAGRGLVAAHAAGIVHRDFKPGNVMVEDNGSVRVLDFGLAHLMDDRPSGGDLGVTGPAPIEAPERVHDEPLAEARRNSREVFATEAGLVIGTPAYMAPEQIVGDRGDHRSEQFSFAMSLYVALYDRSPLAGETYEERRENIVRGLQVSERDLERSASGELVPPRVRQAILRGLSAEPEARFASMTELLVELEEPPRRGRWAAIAGFTLLAGFGVGAMVFDAPGEELPCSDPAAALEGTWGPADRSAVESAFAVEEDASSLPQVTAQLDGYAAGWVEMYGQSCRATFVLHQQSERMFDHRMRCLERRRNRLRSAIDALVTAETPQALVDRTILPFKLPGLEPCADLEALAAEQPLPDDEAQRDQVAQIRMRIDEADTLYDAGEFPQGLEVASGALEQARELQYLPALAEALASKGRLQTSGPAPHDAQTTLEEAVLVAAQAGDDPTAAAAWTWLLYSMGLQHRLDEAFTLELAARAAVERSGDEVVRGWLLNNLGVLHGMHMDLERASEHLRRALEVKQRILGPDHVDVGISWFNLGLILADRGSNEEALEAFEHARSIFEATVGERHPLAHYSIFGLCRVEHALGRAQASVELCREVLKRFEASPPPAGWQSRVGFHLAWALWDAGAEQEALDAARRALAMAVDPIMVQEIEAWIADPARYSKRPDAVESQPPR
jgi:tetratricopeptide (TPR) repeat protein/predicted Ser/Thr protein kinase